jgi:hypothetical protein
LHNVVWLAPRPPRHTFLHVALGTNSLIPRAMAGVFAGRLVNRWTFSRTPSAFKVLRNGTPVGIDVQPAYLESHPARSVNAAVYDFFGPARVSKRHTRPYETRGIFG